MSFTVFLGNLPTWVTADDIKQWLAAEDLVADAVKVIRNHETQESKGFAFVEAPTSDEMQSIIRRFDRAPLEDRLLRANPAQPPKGKDAPRGAAPSPQQPPQHPMPFAPNNVPTAKSAADEIASSLPAARLLPSWRRSCKPGLACPGGASHPCHVSTPVNSSHKLYRTYPSYFQFVIIGRRRAIGHSMKFAWLGCLLVGSLLFAGTQDSDLNVNKRYTVDTVIVAGKGWQTNVADQQSDRLSTGLRKDLAALIGQKLNPGMLDGLGSRLKKELYAREVSHHVLRGDTPGSRPRGIRSDPGARGYRRYRDQVPLRFQAGLERRRRGGLHGPPEHLPFRPGERRRHHGRALRRNLRPLRKQALGTDRVGLRFQFESYHEQWNQSTLNALAAQPDVTSDAYRTRQNFEPTATIILAKPLTLEIGVGFQRFQNQYPTAHTESANALITSLRYHQRLADSEYQQDVDAGYTLRAATKAPGQRFHLYVARGGVALPGGARQASVDGSDTGRGD